MLEGIEILNQMEIMAIPEWVDTIRTILRILSCSGLVLGWGLLAACEKKIFSLISFVFALLSSFTMLGIALNVKNFKEPTGKYEYQVTIDESVSMIEFYERYEIINVEGKIYTIREKD